MARVTLKNIADSAGVSKFAVSRALSGKSGVSDSTRDKIMKLAHDMGYERTTSSKVPTLAVLCEDEDLINGELNQKILSGIRDEVHQLGFDLIELQTTGARRLSDVAQRTDALIFVGVNRPEILADASAMRLPMVKIGTFEPLEQADIVRGTNYETGRVVGELLLENGHEHLVYVRGRRNFRGRQERFNGLTCSVYEHPKAFVTDLRWETADELDENLSALLEGPNPASAFFCAHDGLAVTIVSELLARNISIPAQASVIGYGDYVTAQHIRPSLTTVRVPGAAFGREAVRLVRDRMLNTDEIRYRLRVQIPSELVIRESLGPIGEPS